MLARVVSRKGGGGGRLADGLVQPEQRMAQIVAGYRLGAIGPQQPDQRRPAVGCVGFDGKVDQQGPFLVRPEAGNWLAIQGDLKGSHER